ncbi:MAG: hypothetical protein ACI4EQ_02985, partial [Lachnospiraceae bacterium]
MDSKGLQNRKYKNEKGAIVVETVMSLSAFMFLIVTILTIVNVCIVQQKVGIALNQTAKEIAQYMYIYNLTGVNDIQKENYENGELAREDISDVVTAISGMSESLEKLTSGEATFDEASAAVDDFLLNAEAIGDTATDAIGEGSGWVMSFLRVLGNEAFEEAKGQIAGQLAKLLIQKNLINAEGQSADAYLRNMGVMEGIKGVYFGDTVLLRNGEQDIILIADYHVKLITLLNHDITLHFRQAAITRGWDALTIESGRAEGTEETPKP